MAFNIINIGTLRRTSTSPLSIDWDIEDYFEKPKKADSSFESPLFIFGEATWRLRLFPNGERRRKTVDSVEMFLLKEESFDEVHHISCTMGIKLENVTLYSYKKSSMQFYGCDEMHGAALTKRSQLGSWRSSLGSNKIVTFFVKDLVHLNASNTYASSNTQIQRMDQATSTDEILPLENSRSDNLNPEKEGIEILSENLKGLFLNEEGCDVTFKVENTEVRAHKSVLIAGSPVFASMFRHEMSETITGIVKIADCTPDAFKALLLYMYSGTVEHLSADVIYDLYEAAVKYDLEYLKNKCIKFMKNEVSADTLCDTIALCQKYKEFELLQHATNYFTEHALDILETTKWHLFMKEDPVTANELFIKQCKRNKC